MESLICSIKSILSVIFIIFGITGCNAFNQTIELKRVELLLDDENTLNGLDNPRIARMTPDGKQVLVASADDDALAIYSLDEHFQLTFKWLFKNDERISGLIGANKFVLSDDGKKVFLVSFYDSAVVVFDKNIAGNYQYQETISDKVKWFQEDGKPVQVPENLDKLGLLGAYDIAISPDNLQLYVASSASNAVSVFNLSTEQSITNKQIIRDNQSENYALQSAVSVNSALDNVHVFVASYE